MPYANSSYRTDLAVESLEMSRRQARVADKLPGVRSEEKELEGFALTSVEILDEQIGRAHV